MRAFELACRAADLRRGLLRGRGRRVGGWGLRLRYRGNGRGSRGGALLLLDLLRDGLVSLGVQIQDLVADVFEKLNRDILDKLLPPAAGRLLGRPLLDVKLTQAACQVHHGHGDDFWLPLKRQHSAEAVVYKSPSHLQYLAHFILLPFKLLDVAQQEHVGVLHLQVELDGLEQNPLQNHHLLLWIIAKLGKLHIIQ